MASAQYFGLPGPSGNDCIAAGFSNAVRLPPNAQLVLTAGQAGIDLNTERLVESSPEAQIEACFDCCHVALKLAGVLDGLASAFRITSFLPDQRHDPLMMEIWRRRYPDHRPVWTSVGSGTLGLPGMIVELQAEAYIAPATAPAEHFIALLKRDGGVIVEKVVPLEVIDKCNADIKPKLEAEQSWSGELFPKETRKCISLIANSTTYTTELLMHPLYQTICDHFLTTRNSFWWGNKWKGSVSKPQAHTGAAMYIGPGAKPQPLHRDDYLHHNVHTEVPPPWDDERDKDRESAVGLCVAGTDTSIANGATRFIPGSHLWGNYERKTPPDESKTVHAKLNKGDAFFMFASCFYGGSANTTTDSYRLVYSTFVTRGWLRQEDNMYLAIPRDVLMGYPRRIQRFIGYSCSDPGCGLVDDLDPIYTLYPEELKTAVPTDY